MGHNNNNNSSRELAKILKNSGKMSTGTKILLAVGFVVIVVVLLYIIYPDLFTVKKEGEDCEKEGGDSRGIYKINKNKKCVLDSCVTNWEVSGKKCVKVKTPVDAAPPAAPPAAPAAVDKSLKYSRLGGASGVGVVLEGDLGSLAPMSYTNDDLAPCYEACDADAACGGITIDDSTCYFKANSGSTYQGGPYDGVSYKFYTHKDRRSHMLEGVSGSTTSSGGDAFDGDAQACRIACMNDPGCIGITHVATDTTSQCYGKTTPVGTGGVTMATPPADETWTYFEKNSV